MTSTIGVSKVRVDDDWSWPVHGVRHPPGRGDFGWYVSTGDHSDADDFFLSWHAEHLLQRFPELGSLLELLVGSRSLIVPGHRDIWTDPSPLDV